MNTPLNLESLSFYFDCMKLERARYEINFTTMSRSLLNDQCDAPCFGFPRGCDRSMSVIVIADPIFFATCRTASSVELSLDSPIPEISTEFRRLYCVDCSRYAVLCSTLDCSSPTFARKSAFPFSSVSTCKICIVYCQRRASVTQVSLSIVILKTLNENLTYYSQLKYSNLELDHSQFSQILQHSQLRAFNTFSHIRFIYTVMS